MLDEISDPEEHEFTRAMISCTVQRECAYDHIKPIFNHHIYTDFQPSHYVQSSVYINFNFDFLAFEKVYLV